MQEDVAIITLSQLGKGEDWRLSLAHDRPYNVLIWVTRGQGRLMLDGQRSGVGAHNAVYVPAGALFSLELGRQGFGQVVVIPQDTELRLPQIPRQLRIRDVHLQTELSALIEAAQREQSQGRPLKRDALEAHAGLMSVWLRRLIAEEEHLPPPRNAAARLSSRFAKHLAEGYASGAPMADYARAMAVTPTHLTRAIKAATGKTAADLLTERVLYEARDMLAGSSHSAKDIARHLGFGSAAYFTRFIQQHVGKPPSQLRAKPIA
ncbi:helix-turn-helix domain-containing protein [Sulfitobacter sp. SK012]|uniref:helix-turn-helix domain-containing protein n=1 Tax=Sulfitobacter sp. SK012 TaxID=1389005 RepID=UPI003F8FF437